MDPILEPPDSFHLLAAEGWFELGDQVEAYQELKKITPQLRMHPDVLKVRWAVCSKDQNWLECVDIGQGLVSMEPEEAFGWINRSYAIRRANGGGLQMAYDALRPVLYDIKDVEQVTFNLACYACQLGKIEESKEWLSKSFAAAKRKDRLEEVKQFALKEPDLEPIWKEIEDLE
jgi:hypothetical protein